MGYVDTNPKRECQGHPDGPEMGVTFYCDGTCRRQFREVLFNFGLGEGENVYRGLTDDSTWNGWLVIWVDRMQLDRLIADAVERGYYVEADDFRALTDDPSTPGIYCLENMTPVEVKVV